MKILAIFVGVLCARPSAKQTKQQLLKATLKVANYVSGHDSQFSKMANAVDQVSFRKIFIVMKAQC
jgi:hypothetical protein